MQNQQVKAENTPCQPSGQIAKDNILNADRCEICGDYRCQAPHPRLEQEKPRDTGWITPYQRHEALNHSTTRYSPDSFVIIEECDCGMRFLHNPNIGYPLTIY